MPELQFHQGVSVVAHKKHYFIKTVLDLKKVLCVNAETGDLEILNIEDLTVPVDQPNEKNESQEPTPSNEKNLELNSLSEKEWASAKRKYEIIKPLLELRHRTKKQVRECANENKVGTSTIYKWIDLYERHRRVSALVTSKPPGGKGKSRLDQAVDKIIENAIQTKYLTIQKHKIKTTYQMVLSQCKNANLKPPGEATLRYRINHFLTTRQKIEGREGTEKAQQRFDPKPDNYDEARFPLAVVQIDHTELDIILVDDIERRPVQRPWITLAMDLFSRMVVGYYVSFDPPGNISTGLSIAHAILPKDDWIKKYNLTAEWPVWGKMAIIHADNAGEFHSEMLERACLEHGINLNWRPLLKKEYGGHIERCLGTFLSEIHQLDGTTKSNPKDRGEYDSEAEANMSLSEFEHWLANFIICEYHQRFHHGIKTSPAQKYEEGIFGTKASPGIGLLPRIVAIEEIEKLQLDFIPYEERTIQNTGVVIDYIHYYHHVLSRYIGARSPDNPKMKRKFIFKRDPRNISVIYFYDPELKRYFPIPYRNTSYPAISVWELRTNRNWLVKQGYKNINEDLLFQGREKRLQIEEEARRKTKSTRIAAQRRRSHEQNAKPLLTPTPGAATTEEQASAYESSEEEILPFDEIIEL